MPRPARPLAAAALLALAAALPSSAAADERNAYVVLKGGAYLPTVTLNEVLSGTLPPIESLDPNFAFELGLGGAWGLLGAQLSAGVYRTGNATVDVYAFPVTGVLQLRIPIVFVVPYAEAGVGAWITSAKYIPTGDSSTKVAFEVLAGLGVDVYLGALLLGVEAKYLWAQPTYSWTSVPTEVQLQQNGVVATANLGYRF